MRRTVADWSAGVLAVVVLAFGGLVVVKPALDHWNDLYKSNPFQTGTTTQRVETKTAGAPTVTTITRKQASRSFADSVLGNSGVLLLRVGIAALAALLAAAVLQRAILGSYALRLARTELRPGGAASEQPFEPESEDTDAAPVSLQNGTDSVQEATGANFASAIAKLVASRRETLGLSQRELAKRAGISHTVISRIENGQHLPSAKTVERLADALR